MQNRNKPHHQPQHQLAISISPRDYEQEYLYAKLKPNKLVLLKNHTGHQLEHDLTDPKNHPNN